VLGTYPGHKGLVEAHVDVEALAENMADTAGQRLARLVAGELAGLEVPPEVLAPPPNAGQGPPPVSPPAHGHCEGRRWRGFSMAGLEVRGPPEPEPGRPFPPGSVTLLP
jgi:hypothetical protein